MNYERPSGRSSTIRRKAMTKTTEKMVSGHGHLALCGGRFGCTGSSTKWSVRE